MRAASGDAAALKALVDSPLDRLYRRPGFLIRRANQIAVWLFLEESEPFGLTPTQYGALVILRDRAGIDQIGLAKLLRIDKSTTALVIGKLEVAGHIRRESDPHDKRRNVLRITPAGLQALRNMAAPAERARMRLMTAFDDPEQARRFMGLLERYVGAHSGETVASTVAGRGTPGTAAPIAFRTR